MCSRSLSQCPTIFDLKDYSPPGPSVHGVILARRLEWLPIHPPGDLPNPETGAVSPGATALAGGFFTAEPPGKPSQTWTQISSLLLTRFRGWASHITSLSSDMLQMLQKEVAIPTLHGCKVLH